MRLGGPVYEPFHDPAEWIHALQRLGYRAAYCPVGLDASAQDVQAYAAAARQADIVIAEVGVWNNPLNGQENERIAALQQCMAALTLADEIGANCCVNISGSRGERWDGPDPANLTAETFDLIVESVRAVLDAVKPRRTFYTLETMPWMYPDSVESYLDLIRAIDRPHFGVHLDPVNMINHLDRYFNNAAFLRDCANRLAPWTRSVHIKDTLLAPDRYTININEVRPGLGILDYGVLLTELQRVNPELPVMLEHLPSAQEYQLAAEYVRTKAAEVNVPL